MDFLAEVRIVRQFIVRSVENKVLCVKPPYVVSPVTVCGSELECNKSRWSLPVDPREGRELNSV